MIKKLRISLIFSTFMVSNHLGHYIHAMHNLYANFVKILEICKDFSKDLVNNLGNLPRRGVVPGFSDLEVIALSMLAEHMSIDSENRLFDYLQHHRDEFPNLVSRRQYNVHDVKYMKDVKFELHDCSIFGDRAYISAELKQDLFSSVGIRLEVPYPLNMKDWKPTFKLFAKARKRIETNFSQLCDHLMIFRNYAKQTTGLFTRIIGKVSAFTVLQYINFINGRPIGRVKYALN